MAILQGDLSDYPLADLLQFFHNTRKLGQLLFEHTETRRPAGVFFEHGEVVHAFCPPREGEPAVYQLFNWRQGRFAFLKGARAQERTVHLTLPNILLEGMRRIDETREAGIFDALPDQSVVLHLERDAEKIGDIKLTQSEWRLLSLINGKRSLGEVMDLSDRDEHEAAQLIYGLMVAGLLTETFDDSFLGNVVFGKVPAAEALHNRGQPPSILANLVLRESDGERTMRDIKNALGCTPHELIEEVQLLVRTGWLRLILGIDEYKRFF